AARLRLAQARSAKGLNRPSGEALTDQVELVERAISDRHGARTRIGIGGGPHRQPKNILKMALDRQDVRILARIASLARLAPGLGCLRTARELLNLTHRKPLIDSPLRQFLGVGMTEQRPAMAHVEPAGDEVIANGARQRQEAEEIGDVAA